MKRLVCCASVVVALAAWACTPEEDPPDANAAPSASPTSEPRRGGRVVVGILGEPATLDPYSPLASDLTFALVRPLAPSLFVLQPDGTTIPSLAVEWDLGSNGRSIDVTLARRDWSNGEPITGRDVRASVQRARPPSGFAELSTSGGTRTRVRFRARSALSEASWRRLLARVAFVLPEGRWRPSISGGPFRIVRRTPGLEMVLARNPVIGTPPYLDRVVVQHIQGSEMMLELLERGRLDVAAVPSSVNLDEIASARNLENVGALGWESIRLEFTGWRPSPLQRRALVGAAGIGSIEEGLVREDGRTATTLFPEPGPRGARGDFRWKGRGTGGGVTFTLGAPNGDQLLGLIQRVLQDRWARAGFRPELVNGDPFDYYGAWKDRGPADVRLVRASGGPGPRPPLAPFALPLFHVDTELVSVPGEVLGLEVSPTWEGPLWNAERWSLPGGR